MSRAQDLFNVSKDIKPDKKNFDGFEAYSADIYNQYVQMCMTNTIGDTYYMSSQELFGKSNDIHKKMKDTDPVFMAKTLTYARNKGFMRLQPIIGLAYLSLLPDKSYFHSIFDKIIRTPGDLADFISVAGSLRKGKGLGRTIKRAVNKWFVSSGKNGLSEYHAIKYGGGKETGKWSLQDIMKMTHPIPGNEKQSQLFKYVTTGESNDGLIQIDAFEKLKKLAKDTDDFEKKVSELIDQGRLPYETVTGVVKPTKKIWEHLMQQMPVFALVRHLNALENADVFKTEKNVRYVVEKLKDREIIRKSMMLPFRFSTAYNAFNGNMLVKNALSKSLDLSLDNISVLPGKNAYFLDVSGSMQGEFLEVGSLLGVAALKKSPDSMFYCFSTELKDPQLNPDDTVMTNIQKCKRTFGGGTDIGICIDHLMGTLKDKIRKNYYNRFSNYDINFPEKQKTSDSIFVDNIIIITDEQQNSGSPIVQRFREYRRKVNRNARLFIIDVTPYDGHVANAKEPGITFIYGWSETVLNILKYSIEGDSNHVSHIMKMEL